MDSKMLIFVCENSMISLILCYPGPGARNETERYESRSETLFFFSFSNSYSSQKNINKIKRPGNLTSATISVC